MSETNIVIERIHQLSDKQACYIVKSLTQDIFSKLPTIPSFEELGVHIEKLAHEADINLDLKSNQEWYAVEMVSEASGKEARIILESLAAQPQLDQFIDQAINKYSDEALDLGIISVGVAIAMVYLAVSADFDVDLGWFKLKKKGLNAEQQKEVVLKTLPEVAKTIARVG